MTKSARIKRSELKLILLESRDVPATFYVDPLFAGLANGTTATFNTSGPGSVPNVVIGTNGYSTLNAAVTAANATAQPDTIYMARSRDAVGNPNTTPIDNTAGPITIDDNLTLIGSGQASTILTPTADTADDSTGIFEVNAGKTFTVQNLTLDGSGFQIGIGFDFDNAGVVGSVSNVAVTNIGYAATNMGTAIAAGSGAKLTVTNSQINNYGRIGISFADSTGTVSGSTINGSGSGTTFVNYGIQLSGASAVVITGNTITNNSGSLNGDVSAGVNMFQVGAAAPTATLTNNTITGNTFGIHVGGNFGADKSFASIHNNNLNGNFLAIQADNVATVDATKNWFGDATGPYEVTTNTGGKGSEVTDQVNYASWLTSPYVNTVTVVSPPTVITLPPPPVAKQVLPPPAGLVVGSGSTGQGSALNSSFANTQSVNPFTGFSGEIRVARGDVNGDGIADNIYAAGAGGGPRVSVYDGSNGSLLLSFYAYAPTFTGGLYVAVGDVYKNGYADIITGAGSTGGSNVRVFDGKSGALVKSFYAYDAAYSGGVTVAAGNVSGTGTASIVTGSTAGGGPNVRVFDGAGTLQISFFAYNSSFTGGVYVAVGDVNGDGFADIITGAGSGGYSNVRVFSGQTRSLLNSYMVGDSSFTGGIRVGAEDLDNDGKADILTAQGQFGDNRVYVTYGANLAQGNTTPTASTQKLFGVNTGLYVA